MDSPVDLGMTSESTFDFVLACACGGQVPWLLRGFISFLINWEQQQHAHPGDAVRIEWHDTQQT